MRPIDDKTRAKVGVVEVMEETEVVVEMEVMGETPGPAPTKTS